MNELPIELLYRIALDMDYNTLQNFCKTSQFELRICKNPQFWEDKVNKEFPLDENNWQAIVQETGTAQEAYIRIAGEHDIPFWGAEKYGHIDKLAENAAWTDNFPLINHFYKLSGESGIFYVLGKRNKADFISSFPPKDIEENRDSIMFGALAGGHVDLAQDIIATGGEKINFDAAMWNAAKSGQIPVVEYVLQLMKTQDKKTIIAALNNALSIAIKKQYSHMISFLITEGADNFYRASQKAAEYKNFSLVKEFVSRIGERNVPWDSILYEAAGGGVKEIVDYAIDHGAGDFNAAMLEAAQGGHIHIIEYLISKGADNYIWALLAAINGENIPTIQWLNQRINDLEYQDEVSVANELGRLCQVLS